MKQPMFSRSQVGQWSDAVSIPVAEVKNQDRQQMNLHATYRVDDAQVGQWSAPVSVTVLA